MFIALIDINVPAPYTLVLFAFDTIGSVSTF